MKHYIPDENPRGRKALKWIRRIVRAKMPSLEPAPPHSTGSAASSGGVRAASHGTLFGWRNYICSKPLVILKNNLWSAMRGNEATAFMRKSDTVAEETTRRSQAVVAPGAFGAPAPAEETADAKDDATEDATARNGDATEASHESEETDLPSSARSSAHAAAFNVHRRIPKKNRKGRKERERPRRIMRPRTWNQLAPTAVGFGVRPRRLFGTPAPAPAPAQQPASDSNEHARRTPDVFEQFCQHDERHMDRLYQAHANRMQNLAQGHANKMQNLAQATMEGIRSAERVAIYQLYEEAGFG